MMSASRRRAESPRIGVYLGIFASLLISLVIALLIAESLGMTRAMIRMAMIIVPIVLYLLIAFLAYAVNPAEYFAANRSVPALLNGLASSITCLGSVGLVSLAGLFFFMGHDAFAFAIGWMLGLMVLGILLAPYLRKYGASTVPGYLGRRFASPTLRVLSAVLLAVPVVLVMAAEMKIVMVLLAQFAGQPIGTTLAVGAVLVFLMVSVGGMFGLTWANCAQALAALIGLLVPLTMAALTYTNLPFPQITYGLMLERLGFRELNNGLIAAGDQGSAVVTTTAIPGVDPMLLTKPFIEAFGAMSASTFVITALVLMAGVASMPALLVRSGTTRSVYDMRKSMGWTVFFVGLIMMSLPALAVFFRFVLLDQAIGAPNDAIPAWFRTLVASGFVTVDSDSGALSLENVRFARDGVFAAFPIAIGMPTAVVFLTIAAALAAGLAAISANVLALANMLTDDLVLADHSRPARNFQRLVTARLLVSTAVISGGVVALKMSSDPLRLFVWGLSLSAATIFPALVLSIWWKRVTSGGALIGMVSGFVVTFVYIVTVGLGGLSPLFGIDDMLAAAIGLPVALVVTIVTSLVGGEPQQALLEFVRDIRIPGGETISDRELRIARNKSRETA